MKLFKRGIALLLVMCALAVPVAAAQSAEAAIVNPYGLYTYDQMCADIAALEARYPDLISSAVIGKSVEGRNIPVFTLGKGKREIIICASMHAREYVSTNVVMYLAEQYCRGYAANSSYDCIPSGYSWARKPLSYRTMLDGVRFVIVPMVNPDGVTLAQRGWVTDKQLPKLSEMPYTDAPYAYYYGWKANINGVDLNHNWPYYWKEDPKVKVPSSANYAGPHAMSEPETVAMNTLMETTPFYMLCSFHTYGQCIYWIDDTNSKTMQNQFRPLALRFAHGTGYSLMESEPLGSRGGYMVNYARAKYGKFAMTVELCPNYSYPYSDENYKHNLAYTIERVHPLFLMMADEVLKMDPDDVAIDVRVDNKLVLFTDVRPTLEANRTLVPVRSVCEACGLTVGWDNATRTVTVTDGETRVELKIDSREMTVFPPFVAPETEDAPAPVPEETVEPAEDAGAPDAESEEADPDAPQPDPEAEGDESTEATDGTEEPDEPEVPETPEAPEEDPLPDDGRYSVQLDAPARLINGRTVLPIRAVLEAFGIRVSWDNPNYTVIVTTK